MIIERADENDRNSSLTGNFWTIASNIGGDRLTWWNMKFVKVSADEARNRSHADIGLLSHTML